MQLSDRRARIRRYLDEVVTDDELDSILVERDEPTVYVGYAPTGEMHIGHLTTIRKLVDFQTAGMDVTVLIADVHAHLDDAKSPFPLLEPRSEYYELAIEAMLAELGGDPADVTFVRGSAFELEPPYTMELLRLSAEITVKRAQRAGSEVVRQRDDPRLGGLLYTVLQALDVASLGADVAYGGIDQRGIYMLAREVLPSLGYPKPVCLFAPLLSGLEGGKMSASEVGSTIGLTDDAAHIESKLEGAYCPAGSTENNGVLEYLEYLVFPTLENRGEAFIIDRPAEYGGRVTYESYEPLEAAFIDGELHPQDLKVAAGQSITEILAPIRTRILEHEEILAAAYPDEYAG